MRISYWLPGAQAQATSSIAAKTVRIIFFSQTRAGRPFPERPALRGLQSEILVEVEVQDTAGGEHAIGREAAEVVDEWRVGLEQVLCAD